MLHTCTRRMGICSTGAQPTCPRPRPLIRPSCATSLAVWSPPRTSTPLSRPLSSTSPTSQLARLARQLCRGGSIRRCRSSGACMVSSPHIHASCALHSGPRYGVDLSVLEMTNPNQSFLQKIPQVSGRYQRIVEPEMIPLCGSPIWSSCRCPLPFHDNECPKPSFIQSGL
jgi:hypothetical protein